MYSIEFDEGSAQTGDINLEISKVGYVILLISLIMTLSGISFRLAILYMPGMTIQLTFLLFLLTSLRMEVPNFNLQIQLPNNQVKAKQFITLSLLLKSQELRIVNVDLITTSGVFPVLKPEKSIVDAKEELGTSFILYTPRRGKEWIREINLNFGGVPELFYFSTTIKTDIEIIVLPQPQRIQIPWTLKQKIFDQFISEISISRRGRGDSFLSLRDFEFGDELRHIHWKASAKWGKLITKEFEEPIQLRFLIVVDRSMLMAGPKLEFALSAIIELCSVIRTSHHSCTVLVHGNEASWQHKLGTSPMSLNRLALLLHAVNPEGTYFNYNSLNEYVKTHQLQDTVMIILSDLEQEEDLVASGSVLLKSIAQRILYFACYTPGFTDINIQSKNKTLQFANQHYFRNVVTRSRVNLLYENKIKFVRKQFSGKKSKFHLIEGYNTNILLELRDSLNMMEKAAKSRIKQSEVAL